MMLTHTLPPTQVSHVSSCKANLEAFSSPDVEACSFTHASNADTSLITICKRGRRKKEGRREKEGGRKEGEGRRKGEGKTYHRINLFE